MCDENRCVSMLKIRGWAHCEKQRMPLRFGCRAALTMARSGARVASEFVDFSNCDETHGVSMLKNVLGASARRGKL